MMAKSLKRLESTLETVLKSISNPGALASSAGLLADPNVAAHLPSLNPDGTISGIAGNDSPVVSAAPATTVAPSSTLQPDEQPIPLHSSVLPSLRDGARYEIGGGAIASPDTVASGSNAAKSDWNSAKTDRDRREESPRLHSLPDNTLNP